MKWQHWKTLTNRDQAHHFLPQLAGEVDWRNAKTKGVSWMRHYKSPGKHRAETPWECVRSTKKIDRKGRLYECAGPFAMRLSVSEENRALVFTSERFFLDVMGCRIPLPDWLTPGKIRVTHQDTGSHTFHFTMDAHHPVFGHTFSQAGDFEDAY
jgi:hypothetical protein